MTARSTAIELLHKRRRSGEVIRSILGDLPFEGAHLGEGGSAIVFPIRFGGAAAVAKFLVDLGSQSRRRRFRDEFQKLVRLRHPNIISLYHYEEVELSEDVVLPMIVMERCETSLKRRFGELSSPDERVVLVDELIAQLLPALGRLHQAGIIHRDLKPENILQRSDGSLVLADFGIAKFDPEIHPDAGDLTRGNERLGNRAYSAPEQETNAALAPSADIFAFGQLVHAAIFGQPLRGSTTARATTVDERLRVWDGLLAKMLDMDPALRPQTTEDVRAALSKADTDSRWMAQANKGCEALRRFLSVVSEVIPGGRDLVEIDDVTEIGRTMTILAREASSLELWWTRGPSDHPIEEPPRQIEDGVWLVGRFEMTPERVWVYQPGCGYSRHFIVLLNKARPGFFGEKPEDLSERSEAGWFDGRYVTREEYDDGFARIGGAVVDISKAQLRIRDHVIRAYVLVPRLNVLMGTKRDASGPKIAARIVAKMEAGETMDDTDLDLIQRLPRRLEVTMFD